MLLKKIVNKFVIAALYFSGKCRAIFQQSSYHIKPGYIHRKKISYFDDTNLTDEYQKEVYEQARFYLDKFGYNNILDIGCGSGYKLLQHFSHCNTVGSDISPTYEYLTNKYPDRVWVNALSNKGIPAKTDIIICADVIEHVLNPDSLLQFINTIDFELLFLSTPERNLISGKFHYGPAYNQCHIREWTAKELRNYVSQFFHVEAHMITNIEDATQLIICKKKR